MPPMTDRTRRLAEEPVGKLLLTFSLPAIAGMMVASLYTVIDRAFLGRVVGPDAIGGLTICMPIAFVFMAVGVLIGIGSGALVSIRLGQQRKDDAEAILGGAVALTLIASVILSTVFLITLDPLLRAFGATANTLPYAKQFMRIILLGSFFQYTSFGLNAVIRAEGNPRLAMATQLINAGLNIVLDVVFIYGFGWGVPGAAAATVIAQAVSAAWTLAHFRSRRSVLRLHLGNIRVRWAVVRPALAIGLAPFCMHLAMSVTSLLMNRGLSRHGGEDAVNAYGVIGALAMLAMMPVFGINQGSQPIIGYNYGAGQYARVRRTLRLGVIAATAIMTGGFLIIEAVPAFLIRCFSPHDPALVVIGARGMRIAMLLMPVVGFQVVSANFFQAIGKARTALILTLLRQVIVLIPTLLILPRFLGLDGMWGAGPIADGVSSLLTAGALAYQLRALGRPPEPRPGSTAPSPLIPE
jgi:putative MATE family efflux protein